MTAGTANRKLVVVETAEDVAAAACDLVLAAEREAIRTRGMFTISLAGGSTPRRLYQKLARTDASFDCWNIFFGDERWVAPDHADSNFRMAREALLDHVPIPRRRVHPVETSAGSPAKAAALYELVLRRSIPHDAGQMPRFDVVLLGLGADGHTASLFPGSSALVADPKSLCVATWAPSQHAWRVTMTAALLSAGRAIVFLVSGADKAGALSRLVDGDAESPPPASRIVAHDDATTTIVADRAATTELQTDF